MKPPSWKDLDEAFLQSRLTALHTWLVRKMARERAYLDRRAAQVLEADLLALLNEMLERMKQ